MKGILGEWAKTGFRPKIRKEGREDRKEGGFVGEEKWA